jgi:hypothetical protein
VTKARVNADNASADIQGVTAGTGLSGGGTSGTVSLNVDTAVIQARVANVTDTEIGYLDGVTSALQTQLDSKNPLNFTQNGQSGTTYTFVLADNGKFVTATNASAQTYTVPLNSSVAFPIGTTITLIQDGAGQVTVVPAGGVTLVSTGTATAAPKTRIRYSALSLVKIGTDSWYCIGDIS